MLDYLKDDTPNNMSHTYFSAAVTKLSILFFRVPQNRVAVCPTFSPVLLFKMSRVKKNQLNFPDQTHHR